MTFIEQLASEIADATIDAAINTNFNKKFDTLKNRVVGVLKSPFPNIEKTSFALDTHDGSTYLVTVTKI